MTQGHHSGSNSSFKPWKISFKGVNAVENIRDDCVTSCCRHAGLQQLMGKQGEFSRLQETWAYFHVLHCDNKPHLPSNWCKLHQLIDRALMTLSSLRRGFRLETAPFNSGSCWWESLWLCLQLGWGKQWTIILHQLPDYSLVSSNGKDWKRFASVYVFFRARKERSIFLHTQWLSRWSLWETSWAHLMPSSFIGWRFTYLALLGRYKALWNISDHSKNIFML